MSSLKDFLYQIADGMGRPRDSMNPVVKIFEDNWYDTVESIKDLDGEALEKMKVPMRVIELIQKKLGGSQEKVTVKTKPQEEQKSNVMVVEEQVFFTNQLKKLEFYLDMLKRETITTQALSDVLSILEKILSNILKDQTNETFRTLKLTNEKLQQKLFAYQAVIDILTLIGFIKKEDVLYLQQHEVNKNLIGQVLRDIQAVSQKAKEMQSFDPYKSSFSTMGEGVNIHNVVSNSASTNYDFGQKLEELKQKRWNAVKNFIEDKEVKAFIIDPKTSIQSFLSARDQLLGDENEKLDEVLFKKEILRWAKELEQSQHFTSRRKKEFEQLLKQPLFTETRIRVKFPNSSILEARFSPREPLRNVVELVKKHLVDPSWDFYLFQTPPVQKVTPQNWSKSLEESDMVPNALLYVGFNQGGENITEFITLKPQVI